VERSASLLQKIDVRKDGHRHLEDVKSRPLVATKRHDEADARKKNIERDKLKKTITIMASRADMFAVAQGLLGVPFPAVNLVTSGIDTYDNTSSSYPDARERTIEYALKIYPEIRFADIFGVAGIRCFQVALEETFAQRGLPVSLGVVFDILLKKNVDEDDRHFFAVSIVIAEAFTNMVALINQSVHASNAAGRHYLQFGSNHVALTIPLPKTLKTMKKDMFVVLSTTEDDSLYALVQSEDVRENALERLQRFADSLMWLMKSSFEEDDAAQQFQHACMYFMSAMGILVMKYISDCAQKADKMLSLA
jgi:hypothetical protein